MGIPHSDLLDSLTLKKQAIRNFDRIWAFWKRALDLDESPVAFCMNGTVILKFRCPGSFCMVCIIEIYREGLLCSSVNKGAPSYFSSSSIEYVPQLLGISFVLGLGSSDINSCNTSNLLIFQISYKNSLIKARINFLVRLCIIETYPQRFIRKKWL